MAARHSTRRAEAAEAHLRPPPLRRTSADMSGLGGIRTGNAKEEEQRSSPSIPSCARLQNGSVERRRKRRALRRTYSTLFLSPVRRGLSKDGRGRRGGKFLKKEGVSARFPKKGRRKQDWVCAQNSSQNIFSELFDEGSGGGVLHIFGTNLDS